MFIGNSFPTLRNVGHCRWPQTFEILYSVSREKTHDVGLPQAQCCEAVRTTNGRSLFLCEPQHRTVWRCKPDESTNESNDVNTNTRAMVPAKCMAWVDGRGCSKALVLSLKPLPGTQHLCVVTSFPNMLLLPIH